MNCSRHIPINLENVLITVYLPDVINLKSTGYLWNFGIHYIKGKLECLKELLCFSFKMEEYLETMSSTVTSDRIKIT